MEIAGTIIHCYKGEISQAFIEHLLPHFALTLVNLKSSKEYEVTNAVCFFCDTIEYGDN